MRNLFFFCAFIATIGLVGCGGSGGGFIGGGVTDQMVATTSGAGAMMMNHCGETVYPWFSADPNGTGWSYDPGTFVYSFTGASLNLTILYKDAAGAPMSTYNGATSIEVTYNGTAQSAGQPVTFQGGFVIRENHGGTFPIGGDNVPLVSGDATVTFLGVTANFTMTNLALYYGTGNPFMDTIVVSVPPLQGVIDFGYGTITEASIAVGNTTWAVDIETGVITPL